jgi:Ca2+-binding EF-hand superfamily protein
MLSFTKHQSTVGKKMQQLHKQTIMTLFVVLLSFVLVLSSAHAKGNMRFFSWYDLDNDKTVSVEEFNTAAQLRFQAIDLNNNHTINLEEFKNWRLQLQNSKKRSRLNKLDINADGQISEAEFLHTKKPNAKRRFDKIDINHDGIISESELMRVRKNKNIHKKFKPMQFNKLDINNDGEVTLKEGLLVWSKWFNKLDSNNDSIVTEQEIKSSKKGGLN